MIRKIFVGIALLFCTLTFAQNGSVSPYSFFGLGENRFRGTVENQALGGLSIFADSTALNLRNPAAFGKLGFTVYTAAGSFNANRFDNNLAQETASTASFEYLALGFPLGNRFGVGFGILPFTSVGYQLESQILDSEGNTIQLDQFTGEGGINRVFLSFGYGITKNLSVGVTGNFNFGRNTNEILRLFQGAQFATRQTDESVLNGIDVNFGINYQRKIRKNLELHASATFSPEGTLSSENERLLETVDLFSSSPIVVERDEVDLVSLNLEDIDLVLPQALGFGVGLGKKNKWFAGAEYELKKTSNFENPFQDIDNVAYEDATRFSIGGFYIPKYNSFTSYLSRVTYRAGLRYEETGLRVNNIPVNDFGISFGVGLPLGASKLNIGFEAGRRGTVAANRVEENYFSVNLSLNLLGVWFRKVQYN